MSSDTSSPASLRGWRPPSTLPPLYGAWIDDLLGASIPAETEATCQNCAMCEQPGRRTASGLPFLYKPETKCCTYVPTLRNFQVGLILNDDDPSFAAARATVQARLDARAAVTPAGIGALPIQIALYRLGGALAFGQNRTLRCPHYQDIDGGRCGIWRYRNAVCATWFCKHSRGPVGARFWQALEHLLSTVEHHLTRWCVGELELDPEAMGRLVAPDTRHGERLLDGSQIDGTVDETAYRATWGDWYGREAEFFRRAADLVRRLTWSDALAAAGAEGRLLAGVVAHRYRALTSETLPERLALGRVTAAAADGGRMHVVPHGGAEGLDLPGELWAALPAFDGRRTAVVLRAVAARHGLELQPSLLRKLVDFDVLVPVGDPAGAR